MVCAEHRLFLLNAGLRPAGTGRRSETKERGAGDHEEGKVSNRFEIPGDRAVFGESLALFSDDTSFRGSLKDGCRIEETEAAVKRYQDIKATSQLQALRWQKRKTVIKYNFS